MHTKYLINSRDSEALASKDEAKLKSSHAVYNSFHHTPGTMVLLRSHKQE